MKSRTWAEIDLSAVRENVHAIQSLVGPHVEVMAVVKADAYGHGAAAVTRTVLEAGLRRLGVATVEEGAALRVAAPDADIVLLPPFGPGEEDTIARDRLVATISDVRSAEALSAAALRAGTDVRVHLEVDTGMGRSGALAEVVARLARAAHQMPGIAVRGLMTHFPSPESDPDLTAHQLMLLAGVRGTLATEGIRVDHVHAAASAGLLRYPGARLDMVRPGLLIYGIVPALPADVPVPAVRPVLTLKSRVVLARDLPAGHTISYGCTHTLTRPSRVGTVPVGYADGYPRALSNRGHVLVAGRRAPILGRVCMDVMAVDLTDIPEAAAGAEVVLIGRQGEERITVEQVAALVPTTEHDVTTRLSARVPRLTVE